MAYCSRCITPTEQTYHSYELETLAVVESVRRSMVHLIEVHFKAKTDCNPVSATLLKTDLLPRIARWWLVVPKVKYWAGRIMQDVDGLSRKPGGESESAMEMSVHVVFGTEVVGFLLFSYSIIRHNNIFRQ